MRCSDLHVNVQDAAMDRILAGELLTKHDTNWQLWTDKFGDKRRRGGGAYKLLHEEDKERQAAEEEDQRVGHVLGHMREGGRKFEKTPKLRRWEKPDSCRIFGSLEGNKVQGDFHITARGHGYMEFGLQQHLDHSSMSLWLPKSLLSLSSFRAPPTSFLISHTETPQLTCYSSSSFQFLPYHNRTLLRPPLSRPAQPPRQNLRHHGQKLLQIPILPLHRAHHLHPPPPSHHPLRLPRPRHDPATTHPRHGPESQPWQRWRRPPQPQRPDGRRQTQRLHESVCCHEPEPRNQRASHPWDLL
jgi:hypothetical protein